MQLGLLENALFTRRRHCINLWSTGKMLLMFDFEDSYRLVLLQENTIVSAIIEYFRALRKAEAVRTKEETLEIMQQCSLPRKTQKTDTQNEKKRF